MVSAKLTYPTSGWIGGAPDEHSRRAPVRRGGFDSRSGGAVPDGRPVGKAPRRGSGSASRGRGGLRRPGAAATATGQHEGHVREGVEVWTRFYAAQGLPELEATRGAFVAFVVWLLDRGRVDGKGYAPSSASTILAGAVVELRRRGVEVGRDDQTQAWATMEAGAVELLKAGERRRRGRGPRPVPGGEGLSRHPRRGPGQGTRPLTGFHYASRAQDPAGLLAGDVALTPRGLVVSVLTGKTRHSVRDAKINY